MPSSKHINDDDGEEIIKRGLKEGEMEKTSPSKNVVDLKEGKIVADPKSIDIANTSANQKVKKVDPEKVCRFFAQNKCKFAIVCRNEHPKICNKFKKFGLKKFNKSGCDKDCEYYHPKACYESMKSKTCSRKDCYFYHLQGTKKEDQIQTNNTPVTILGNLFDGAIGSASFF